MNNGKRTGRGKLEMSLILTMPKNDFNHLFLFIKDQDVTMGGFSLFEIQNMIP